MARSLSVLINNLAEGTHDIKCKYGHDNNKCETCGIKHNHWECFFDYTSVKDRLITFKKYQKEFDESFKKWFVDTSSFFNHDITKFKLLLQKSVYPYKYIDDWGKFNENLKKADFYSHLNMEDITNADYMSTKQVCNHFETERLSEHRDLYVQRDTLLLADRMNMSN